MSYDYAIVANVMLRREQLIEEAAQQRRVAEARAARKARRKGRVPIRGRMRPAGGFEPAGVAAVRDILPVAAGIVPFALIIGVTMQQTGISELTGLVSAAVLYAGSAQLSALSLLEAGAGIAVVVAAVALVNSRFLVYGAGLEPRFRAQPRWFRWVGPQFIVDQTYALAMNRRDLASSRQFRHYWLAMAGVLGVVYIGAMGVGVLAGPALPEASPLDFVATAVFVGLLAPRIRGARAVVVAVAAAIVSVVGADLPNGLGLGAGVAAGFVVAALLERGRR